jgi:DNA-binding transcriptional regulator YhcF (GntR family)
MSQQLEQLILCFLRKEYPKDFSIEEIAIETKIHRNTVSKYLFGLEKEGKIKNTRTVGRAKMYTIVNK